VQSSESLDIFRRCLKTELFERSYNWHRACQTTLLLRDSLSPSRSFLLSPAPQPWSLSTIMLLWHSFLIIIIIIIIADAASRLWSSCSWFHVCSVVMCHSVGRSLLSASADVWLSTRLQGRGLQTMFRTVPELPRRTEVHRSTDDSRPAIQQNLPVSICKFIAYWY